MSKLTKLVDLFFFSKVQDVIDFVISSTLIYVLSLINKLRYETFSSIKSKKENNIQRLEYNLNYYIHFTIKKGCIAIKKMFSLLKGLPER
jgi:hypothetical protein